MARLATIRLDLAQCLLDMNYGELAALGSTLHAMVEDPNVWDLKDTRVWAEMLYTWAESHIEAVNEEAAHANQTP